MRLMPTNNDPEKALQIVRNLDDPLVPLLEKMAATPRGLPLDLSDKTPLNDEIEVLLDPERSMCGKRHRVNRVAGRKAVVETEASPAKEKAAVEANLKDETEANLANEKAAVIDIEIEANLKDEKANERANEKAAVDIEIEANLKDETEASPANEKAAVDIEIEANLKNEKAKVNMEIEENLAKAARGGVIETTMMLPHRDHDDAKVTPPRKRKRMIRKDGNPTSWEA
jgi:hypothetical protein